jgi:UDP-GlcNAc:undecaprenyl-phosphate GlcNAc-1-phosphate transferase
MSFPFHVYLLAIAASFLAAMASLPLWRKWCLRAGLVDDPGHRKIHDRPIPLAGGLAVMTGLAIPLLGACLVIWCHSGHLVLPLKFLDSQTITRLEHGFHRRQLELAGIVIGALGMLAVGLLDDKYELRPQIKFGGQLAVASLVAVCGARITLFVPNILFSYGITILWILTVINAFNFMDNMNGLCGGLGAIGAWWFAIVATAGGQYLVALIAFLTFGSLLGFLPYNFPRARAFLGDAGSHLVGYLLAVLAILPHFYTIRHPRHWAVLIPLLVLAVPLLDLVWVVAIRWRIGQPFYQGDTNHLSHRLVRRGFTRTQTVLLIWLLAASLGALVCLG